MLFLPLLLLLPLSSLAQVHLPISRRDPVKRSNTDWKALRESTLAKFSRKSNATATNGVRRRANSASVGVTDLGQDSTYFATISLGTPAKSFNVILDTGSSDLFIASSQCNTCGGTTSFDPTQSSSVQQSQTAVDLQYGSGEAQGTLTKDIVALGGFSVPGQAFVLAQEVSQGLLQGSLSGLLGLAFQSIAETQATPFVQQLATSNQLSSPEMGFYLQREITNNNAPEEAPGGSFTLGGTDSSKLSGAIDFVNLPTNVQPSFWLLPVTAVGVQGTTLTVNAGTQSLAAIDTGTTLIGGPTEAVSSIYSHITGSEPLTGQMQGYFAIPCSTSVKTSFTFGSKTWSISPDDFTVQQLSQTLCLGAIFGFDLGAQGGPDWVIGDTFLKNVYSVFRFSPASVGFANLASNLQGSPPPSPSPPSSNTPRPPVPTTPTTGSSSSPGGPPAGSISIGGAPLPTGGNGGGGGGSGGTATVGQGNPFSTGNPGNPGSPVSAGAGEVKVGRWLVGVVVVMLLQW